ncbi:MAG: DUF4340 domain-containing protein [Hyphomicrobium sp.]|jgi:hypothetical protein
MQPQHFAALASAAAVSLVTALAVYTSHAPWVGNPAGGGKLLPSLAARTQDITSIAITQGGKTLTLERKGDRWSLRERDGFPASNDKIRALLIGLAEADLLEPKTRNKDRYPLLDLEEPSSANGRSRLIRIMDASGRLLGETIAGKGSPDQLAGKSGTYVRKPGDAQSWLASTAITGGTSLGDWTQPRVFETATEAVSRLTIELTGEAPYDIKRDGDQHVLADIPPGKKIKFINATDTMVEAASFLDFEDVRKAEGDTTGSAGQAVIEAANGLKITMKIRRDKDATWATLSAQGDGEAKKAVDEINSRAAGWEFRILPSKANTILKRRDDLLEDAAS